MLSFTPPHVKAVLVKKKKKGLCYLFVLVFCPYSQSHFSVVLGPTDFHGMDKKSCVQLYLYVPQGKKIITFLNDMRMSKR